MTKSAMSTSAKHSPERNRHRRRPSPRLPEARAEALLNNPTYSYSLRSM